MFIALVVYISSLTPEKCIPQTAIVSYWILWIHFIKTFVTYIFCPLVSERANKILELQMYYSLRHLY